MPRNTLIGICVIAVLGLGVVGYVFWPKPGDKVDPRFINAADSALVTLGKGVYDKACAACHGRNLQGQPNWRVRQGNGRLPAPPHDATGHTWHHADMQLFFMVREGTAALAPPGYVTDMPAFKGRLTDREISGSLAYIKSKWPDRIKARQAEISRRALQGRSR
jgi:mono/diheme cytochrome c family protein